MINTIEKINNLKLVQKAAKGNREAFGELIVIHQEYLYRLAYLHTKNEQDALDAVQECAMRAMISMDKLREPAYFKTWITRILLNSIYQGQKKCKGHSPFEDYCGAAPELPVSIEEKTDLYNAIDLLSPTYKTVVVLQYFVGLRIKDIAQIMDLPIGSVKGYLFRAKEALKNQLEEQPTDRQSKQMVCVRAANKEG